MNIPDASLYLSEEEQKELLTRRDLRGLWEVLKSWGIIVITFTVVFQWPNVFTVIIALFVLGGRQLGISVLMHDSSHKSLFRSSGLNDFFGKWFGGYPLWTDMLRYRPYHVRHHVHTGLDEDPDTNLTKGFPAGKKSLSRKIFRDLSGLTGVKTFTALMMMHLGYLEFDQGNNPQSIDQSKRSWAEFFRTAYKNLIGPLVANIILFLVLSIFSPFLYLLWVGAYLTAFQFSTRVRSIAEHSMVNHPKDPYENTRTTYANVFERMIFAPHNVNYHAEHHMLMGVPCYNLPRMHDLIKAKGFFERGTLANGYWEILNQASQSRN